MDARNAQMTYEIKMLKEIFSIITYMEEKLIKRQKRAVKVN